MIFPDNTQDATGRLDWNLLRYSPISLYSDDDLLEQHVNDLEGEGYSAAVFECDGRNRGQICKQVGAVLGIETEHDELSLDAFDDHLYDPGRLSRYIPTSGGLIFVLRGFDHVLAASGSDAHDLLDVLSVHSRIALMLGLRWIVVIKVEDPDFSVEPIQTQVKLNQHEALSRSNALVDWDSVLED